MSLRVLIVDDDARFRATACRALRADGVEVVGEVDNGRDVAAAVAQCQPDVVLLDIGLPDMDGLEVARRMRREPSGPMVILISTRDTAYGWRVADGLAVGYLPKDRLSLPAILDLTASGP